MGFFIKIYENLSIYFNNFKSLLRDLFAFLFVKIYFTFLLLINAASWYGAYFIYNNINQDTAILHYNVDFGIDFIGNKSLVFIIPALGLFFIIFNKIALLLLLKKNDFVFWAYFLLSFLALLNIFLLISLFSVYLINF
jgi:hypothetical protein